MFENSCEYIIKQKNEGAVLFKKIGLASSYAAVAVLLSILNLAFAPEELMPLFFAIIAIIIGVAVFVSWRFVCIEYEVMISGGELTITTIYGKSFSKTMLTKSINAFSEIGEYDESSYGEISKLSIQKDYVCISSLSAPTIYYGIFEEENERHILYFDVTEKAVSLLKKSNSSAFRASERRMSGINK